jgi:hypothetical protein
VPPRRLLIAALAAGLLVAGAPGPRALAEPPPTQPPPTQIVGGDPVPPGQFGWTAALVEHGLGRMAGFSCGGAVIGRSWVVTAAHCVLDVDDLYPDAWYGPYVSPGFYDVVTGTTSLAEDGGGQRLAVAAVYAAPDFVPATSDDDVALLRLARPTLAPEVAVIGSSSQELALDDAGRTATVTGWGRLAYQVGGAQEDLRSVEVPIQSDATCSGAYPPGFADDNGERLEYHAATMVCAGPMEGGKDACQGDSGGPLVVQAGDGSWREVGVVSTGYKCAEPGYPGLYSRLAHVRSWVSRTRRFGPFDADGLAFVAQQYRDLAGHDPSVDEARFWLAYLADRPASELPMALLASDTWQGNAGALTRLYLAAFGRNPDTAGLTYWVGARWGGRGLVSIAEHFTRSAEFQRRYGALDDDAFVTQLYRNVLGRDPDPSGRAHWTAKLAAGTSRGRVLYELSSSSEHRRRTDAAVRIVTTRFGLLRRVPTAAEITAGEALGQRALVDALRTSYDYAARFSG